MHINFYTIHCVISTNRLILWRFIVWPYGDIPWTSRGYCILHIYCKSVQYNNYFFMYSIELYCVTKTWAPHWLHSASGAESRISPWKTVICIFICITLCVVIFSQMLYTLHMTPNTLMLTYLFNTTSDSLVWSADHWSVDQWSLWSVISWSVINYHCVKNHWMKAIDHYQANLNYCSFFLKYR